MADPYTWPVLQFTIDGQPKGKPRHRYARQGDRITSYADAAGKAEEQRIKAIAFVAQQQLAEPWALDGQYSIEVTAYYPIPASRPKAWQDMAKAAQIRPIVKPDGDNILKLVCDALNGICWRDDAQAVIQIVSKHYGEEPRLEVRIMNRKHPSDRWSK